eukprot:gene15078-4498_t
MAAQIPPVPLKDGDKYLSYEKRAELADNAMAKRLFSVMADKRTNISFNPDFEDGNEILEIADK